MLTQERLYKVNQERKWNTVDSGNIDRASKIDQTPKVDRKNVSLQITKLARTEQLVGLFNITIFYGSTQFSFC